VSWGPFEVNTTHFLPALCWRTTWKSGFRVSPALRLLVGKLRPGSPLDDPLNHSAVSMYNSLSDFNLPADSHRDKSVTLSLLGAKWAIPFPLFALEWNFGSPFCSELFQPRGLWSALARVLAPIFNFHHAPFRKRFILKVFWSAALRFGRGLCRRAGRRFLAFGAFRVPQPVPQWGD